MWNIAITTYLPNPIYFKIQGIFFHSSLFLKSVRSRFRVLFVRSGGKLLEKCLILLLLFLPFRLSVYIYPQLWDNVIRDWVLYISYQFSFKNLSPRFNQKMPPGVYLKSLSLRKLETSWWKLSRIKWGENNIFLRLHFNGYLNNNKLQSVLLVVEATMLLSHRLPEKDPRKYASP